mmetsp:Transcript_55416/g.119190  ORF Transcript_55416/g.119190 Transcript_55416/m.119190 type:complete len:395 (-) Transcript_55416:152-1336(-)
MVVALVAPSWGHGRNCTAEAKSPPDDSAGSGPRSRPTPGMAVAFPFSDCRAGPRNRQGATFISLLPISAPHAGLLPTARGWVRAGRLGCLLPLPTALLAACLPAALLPPRLLANGDGDLKLGRLLAQVDVKVAVTSGLLGELDEDLERFHLGPELRSKHLRLQRNACRVVDEIHDISEALDAIGCRCERLLVILIVVERQMIHGDARALVIVHIMLERMRKQVQLEAQGHQGPILSQEVLEHRHATANVHNIIDAEDIKSFEVDRDLFLLFGLWHLRILRLRLLSLRLCLLRLCLRSCFQGSSLLGLHGLVRCLLRNSGLVLSQLRVPLRKGLRPLRDLVQEPLRRLDFFDAGRQLLLQDPGLDVFHGLRALLPLALNLIKTVGLLRHGEFCEG